MIRTKPPGRKSQSGLKGAEALTIAVANAFCRPIQWIGFWSAAVQAGIRSSRRESCIRIGLVPRNSRRRAIETGEAAALNVVEDTP